MLNAIAGNAASDAPITHASLHTAYPASSANELTGGSPAYARKAVTWEAVAGTEAAGSLDMTNAPVFDVPGGVTVAAVGFWSAVTGGTLMAHGDVTDEVFASQGQYTVNDGDLSITG